MTLLDCERISELVAAGVNLAGIDRILSLEDRNATLDERNVTLEGDNDALRHGEFARTSFASTAQAAAAYEGRGLARRVVRWRPVMLDCGTLLVTLDVRLH